MKRIMLFIFAICYAFAAWAQYPTASASGVTFRYCEPTASALSVSLVKGEEWNGYTFDESGVYTRTIQNMRGCDSIVTLTVNYLEGALPGKFSIEEGKQVRFAQGNLQYNPLPISGEQTHIALGMNGDTIVQGVWRFAPNQYDIIGDNNTKASSSYLLWIDCFMWGCSGWKSDKQYYYPWTYGTGTANANTHLNFNLYDEPYVRGDWSFFNAISNGGNKHSLWFTLSAEQWTYLYSGRENAPTLRSPAQVVNVNGYIFLPDDWELPNGAKFVPDALDYMTNVYTEQEWKTMEHAGAVFLPASGRMNGYTYEPQTPYYWTTTNTNEQYGCYVTFTASSFTIGSNGGKYYARPIRSVQWVK